MVTLVAHRYGTHGTTFVIMYLSKLTQQVRRGWPAIPSHPPIWVSTLGTPPAGYPIPMLEACDLVKPTSELLTLPDGMIEELETAVRRTCRGPRSPSPTRH